MLTGQRLSTVTCPPNTFSRVAGYTHVSDSLPSSQRQTLNIPFTAAVGVIGATVMPHSLFLGSALATQDRVSTIPPLKPKEKLVKSLSMTSDDYENATKTTDFCQRWRITCLEWFTSPFRVPPADPSAAQVKTHADRVNRPLSFVRAHLNHGIFDVVASLLGFAVLINSL